MRKAIVILVLLGGTALADTQQTQTGQAGPTLQVTPGQQACLDALSGAKQTGKAPIAAIVETWGICGGEYNASVDFVAYLDESLLLGWHDREAAVWTRNENHVIYAYAAIWILTMGFVGMMFMRQQK